MHAATESSRERLEKCVNLYLEETEERLKLLGRQPKGCPAGDLEKHAIDRLEGQLPDTVGRRSWTA